jgi:hypothetical protein
MAENRCIVIVGAAYCGSTFLSRLFASVPGVASVGEAKRLYRIHTERRAIHEASCTVCKPPESCPYFGPRNSALYQGSLTKDNLYLTLLMQLPGCRTVVVSDKDKNSVIGFTRQGRADLVVLFKRPEAAALSRLRNDAKRPEVAGIDLSMAACAHHYEVEYSEKYGGALGWVDDWARRSYWVSYEQLAMDPDYEFGLLCKAMDLPVPNGLIDFGNIEWHQIGGNVRSLASRWALLDERWRTELTDAQKREIAGYDDTQEVFHKLLARSLETRLEAHRKTKVQADRRRGDHR